VSALVQEECIKQQEQLIVLQRNYTKVLRLLCKEPMSWSRPSSLYWHLPTTVTVMSHHLASSHNNNSDESSRRIMQPLWLIVSDSIKSISWVTWINYTASVNQLKLINQIMCSNESQGWNPWLIIGVMCESHYIVWHHNCESWNPQLIIIIWQWLGL